MKTYLKDDTVSIQGLVPEMILGMMDVRDVLYFFGVDFVITSGSEASARHMSESKHYSYEAIDCRSRDLPFDEQRQARDLMAMKLGWDFDVVLEKDHFHVEHDPK